jgi:XapX domain-containing protein
MEMLLVGIALGLAIGFCCRWFDIPLPSPPNIVGALLVVSMTLGFLTANTVFHKDSTVKIVDISRP